MDGPSVEHSDSDSGESWTLLENNSVYADEAPEFIEEQAHVKESVKWFNLCLIDRQCICNTSSFHETNIHEAQHHEKDEDTDGISIISDSDHETPSPPPPDHGNYEKSPLLETLQPDKDIPEYIPLTPHLPNIDNNDQDAVASEDFLADTHAKHKTYVHRRNKRLSTVLNIIVLGSVITAAGVAIGHMWGAKNDCTMQTTSSVNKILSNLYKLQEENAYLRSKLKEFNNNQIPHQKIQYNNHNKCRRVFEESLSNNDPRKLTKCVDDNYKNMDNLIEHLVKPKFEKEFVADIDKLKTVYLQNKSWLDDEISRRMKIEEELLKKYNNEVNSAKEQKKGPINHKNDEKSIFPESRASKEQTLHNYENPTADYLLKKVTYADSLQGKHNFRSKRDDKKYTNDEGDGWLTSKYNINKLDPVTEDLTKNVQSQQNHEPKSISGESSFVADFAESAQKDYNDHKEQYIIGDNWTEVKPKFRRNEERYEIDYESKQKINNKISQKSNADATKEKQKFPNNEPYSTGDNTWSKDIQGDKSRGKKEKRNKKSSHSWKNYSNEDRVLENLVSEEDLVKDDRYLANKLKQEKKKNGYINSNKKQKRKIKHQKWNTKGEFGERYDAVETPEDFVLNYPDKIEINFDRVSFIKNINDIDRVSNNYKSEKKSDNTDQVNWFEKRAEFRTEARKKYYEQFAETSPNNSSWYFRRMRKREQCRAKGDNSTFKRVYKDKKNYKIKH